MLASSAETRDPVTVFVPVNDSTKTDQLLPSARSRQPRHFPTSIPHCDELFYVWDDEIDKGIADSLEKIAFDVSRLGHSSSLVQAWVETDFDAKKSELHKAGFNEWIPEVVGDEEPSFAESKRMRVASTGYLAMLESSYNLKAIDKFVALEAAVKESNGKEKKERKSALAKQFPDGIPSSHRPPTALSVAYHIHDSQRHAVATSCFDSDILVLSIDESPTLGLESTLRLSGAVRKKIHDAYPDRKSPEWLGGHRSDGSPTSQPHVAIVPLPFVGHRHADGHLMGVAMVFPRNVAKRDRAMAIRGLFERCPDENDWVMNLCLRDFRELTRPDEPDLLIPLVREQRLTPPRSLRTATWTRACSVWETVTPIVLDRFPKKDRAADRQLWLEEVAQIISKSCTNIGLPEPYAVHVHHNAFLAGVPKARPNGGFPQMPARTGKPSRYQVHARIEFGVPIEGPLILGAGRFVGYGFCKPNFRRCENRRRNRGNE